MGERFWGAGPLQATSKDVSGAFDFARLERAVSRLVEEQAALRQANLDLRTKLDARDARVRTLEEQLRTANQLRQDVAKRIDELIGQIDQLDSELAAAEAGSGGGAGA